MSLAAGARIGPYEIVELLGAGGMGEVYRARDPRLERDVALKVLPERFADSPERLRRFEREARSAGALSHPNVLTVFDVGAEDGWHYLVSELLEGHTFAELIRVERFDVRRALSLMLQVARGVACAHEAGILHRDLKPANLFLTRDGRVKVLDFGVAKLVQPERSGAGDTTATGTTSEGSLVGTAAYMSPEQIRDEPLDGRSDVFAMGAILYELLAGRPAFGAPTASDVMAAILRDEPQPVARLGAAVPPGVEALLRKCLAKRREERFGSAIEMCAALEALLESLSTGDARLSNGSTRGATMGLARFQRPTRRAVLGLALLAAAGLAATAVARRGTKEQSPHLRIVVLPFQNVGAAEDAYFAAGLTDEIIGRLANVRGLSVISRTTAMQFDRAGKTVREIGDELDVDYVLDGTVSWEGGRRETSRVRVVPALTRVSDDTQVWSDRYDRLLSDIFEIQAEMAENVTRTMGVKLVPSEMDAIQAVSTTDMEGYQAYLRGLRNVTSGQGKEDFTAAIVAFQAAVDRDSKFTQALAHLVKAHAGMYFYHYDRSPVHVDAAKKALRQLEALGPELAETHKARGYFKYWVELDYPGALTSFESALTLQPGNSEVLEGIAFVLKRQGRWEESAATSARGLELDPRSPHALFQHGLTCVLLKRYAEGERVFALAAAINPQFAQAWALRARMHLAWRGDAERAWAIASEARKVHGLRDAAGVLANEAFRIALARRDFESALREASRERPISTQFFYLPMDLLRGQVHRLKNEDESARTTFESARAQLQEEAGRGDSDPDAIALRFSSLGIAYAGLGRRAEALDAAHRATTLVPPSRDAWRSLPRIQDLALVHTMLGETDAALDQLDFLLGKSGELSTHILRLDPRWEALKSSPRFEAILKKHGDPR